MTAVRYGDAFMRRRWRTRARRCQTSRTRCPRSSITSMEETCRFCCEGDQPAARVEVDDEPGGRPGVDDLGDRARRAVLVRRRPRRRVRCDAELLRAHAEGALPAEDGPGRLAGEQVGGADEAGHERRWRAARRPRPGVPTCSIRPRLNTATRSLIVSASSWSWVTNTKVMPTSRWIAFSSTCISSRSLRSSAPSGSSSSSTRGRLTSARARATRCRWPPESWVGLRRSEALQPHRLQGRQGALAALGLGDLASPAARTRRCPARSCAGTARSPGRRC